MASRRSLDKIAEELRSLSLRSPAAGGDILAEEEDETVRFANVRKKDFKRLERVRGRLINILDGLELHTGVFSAAEQRRIVDCIYDFQEKGRRGRLRELDSNGNPPGIIRNEEVNPIPPLLKQMIKRMVAWHVLPPTCIPNSCIVNIYDKDDCIPPHIDHHDFVRPFCTVSFLSECNIIFRMELKIIGPGDFLGSVRIPLPLGSVLILNGNDADVAKHCIPAVAERRKMDESKIPYNFIPDTDLQNIRLLPL